MTVEAKLPKAPAVLKDTSHDKPVLLVETKKGVLALLYQQDGYRLGMVQVSAGWWGRHLFATKDKVADHAKLMKQYALTCGATTEAADALKKLIDFTPDETQRLAQLTISPSHQPEEPDMNTNLLRNPMKQINKSEAAKAKSTYKRPKRPYVPAHKIPPEKDPMEIIAARGHKVKMHEPLDKQTRAAKPKVAKPKAPKDPAVKRVSASSRFVELIMAGELTDDEIFATVQEEFHLDDAKRSYVNWYRNKLKKDGKNPPARK